MPQGVWFSVHVCRAHLKVHALRHARKPKLPKNPSFSLMPTTQEEAGSRRRRLTVTMPDRDRDPAMTLLLMYSGLYMCA